MYLVAALLYLCLTIVAVVVYLMDLFGNKVENVVSNFWISGVLCLTNVGLYLYARNKYLK